VIHIFDNKELRGELDENLTQNAENQDEQEEQVPLPKWEWLIISAAALRVFLPIILVFAVLLGLFAFLLSGIL